LLATFPGISQINQEELGRWCSMFTSVSVRRLFEEAFPAEGVEVETYGNLLAAIVFPHGLAEEELRRKELPRSRVRGRDHA